MTLLAHAPLQKSLTVTTYSSQPDANGIHNVASTATLNTTMTSEDTSTLFESVNVLTPDEKRISDVFAFKLDKTKNVTYSSMPSDANIISFWGYVDNTWNLYVRDPIGYLYKSSTSTSIDFFVSPAPNFSLQAQGKDTYIADIRFHKIDDVSSGISAIYAMLNKHPKTPSFGFYQLAHSSNIGIVGNQLDDSLVAFKKGSDDTSFHLADIQCNEIHSKTIDDLKNDLQNINLSYDANGTDVNLQYLYENKIDTSALSHSGSSITNIKQALDGKIDTSALSHNGSSISNIKQELDGKINTSALSHNGSSISNIKQELDKKANIATISNQLVDCGFLYINKIDKFNPVFSGTLTGPELQIGTTQDSTFTPGTLSAGTISSTISNDGTTKTHTLHKKAEAYSYDSIDDDNNPIKVPVTLETLHNSLASTANALSSIQSPSSLTLNQPSPHISLSNLTSPVIPIMIHSPKPFKRGY